MTPTPGVSTHARQRAVERLGRALTDAEWRQVVLDIVEGRSLMRCRYGDLRELHLVQVGSVQANVVWKPHAAVVVTVKPEGSHADNGRYET